MLLDEIITLLGSEQGILTDALLKTKILLHQIGKKELVEWVNNELNGYPDDAELPAYRILPSVVLGNFASLTFRKTAHPLPIGHLDAEKQAILQRSRMHQSLAVLEQMGTSKQGMMRPLPMELNFDLRKGLAHGIEIERAWCHISSHDITGILFQVRSRLLDFLLELKNTVGETATETELREKSNTLDAQSMFRNAIFGSNTTILIGHQSTITASQTISGSELAERVRALVEQVDRVLPTSDLPSAVLEDSQGALAELREAAAASTPDVSRLRRGLESLKHVMEHATGHVVATGVLALIAELLSRAAH
jgi:hypothetical protein